jgi:hypothetical protein
MAIQKWYPKLNSAYFEQNLYQEQKLYQSALIPGGGNEQTINGSEPTQNDRRTFSVITF